MLDFDHLLVIWYSLKARGPEFISVDTLRDFYQSPPPSPCRWLSRGSPPGHPPLKWLLDHRSYNGSLKKPHIHTYTWNLFPAFKPDLHVTHASEFCAVPGCRSRTAHWSLQPDCEVGVLETDHNMRIKPTSNGPLINLVELSQHWCMPLANAPNLQVFLCNLAVLHEPTLSSARTGCADFSLFSSSSSTFWMSCSFLSPTPFILITHSFTTVLSACRLSLLCSVVASCPSRHFHRGERRCRSPDQLLLLYRWWSR